jgi:L-threonylcarbamoyladenylate synthase
MKIEYTDALHHLKEGHVLLCPTDSLWGLSCDATNDTAVQKIIELKQRPLIKSFIVLVNSLDMLGLYVHSFPNFALDIIEYAENPLTVIFPKGEKLANHVINEDGSVAIRLVKPINDEGKFCCELIRKFNGPIVSTSANYSGDSAPRSFSEISNDIKDKVDFVVPYFQNNNAKKQASKIIRLNEDGTFKVLR